MAETMLRFTAVDQRFPAKRAAPERTDDFLEIAKPYILAKAEEQASRCSQCGVPFCQVHCPLHNNIPDWLRLTAEGRLEEAYELSAATSSMPEICGRICPQDRLCEGNCVIEKDFGSVTIGAVEKFITDTAWEQGWVKPIRVVADRTAVQPQLVEALTALGDKALLTEVAHNMNLISLFRGKEAGEILKEIVGSTRFAPALQEALGAPKPASPKK